MITFINDNDVINAVYDLINGDATLQGSTLLGSANKVFTQRSPQKVSTPYVVIELQSLHPNAMQHYTGELRLHCYTSLQSNGMIDPKGNDILNRCELLLTGIGFNDVESTDGALPNITIQPLYGLGKTPSRFNPTSNNEKAKGMLRFRLSCGYNSL